MIFFFKCQRTIPKAMITFLLCTADFCQLLFEKKKALATLEEAKVMNFGRKGNWHYCFHQEKMRNLAYSPELDLKSVVT